MNSVVLAVEANMDLFIGEIKKYPAIWDLRSECYNDRNKKRSAWISVCKELCDEFEAKEDWEKNEICDALSKKWRNIKDAYAKSLKKPKTGSGRSKRPYLFAKQLSFLSQVTVNNESDSSSFEPEINVDVDLNGAPVDANADERGVPALEDGQSTPPAPKNPSKKQKRDLEECLINFMNTPLPVHHTVQTVERSQHQSFFDSLIPTLNKFSDEETMDFRIGVLQVVRDIQRARRNQNHGPSTTGSA